jgi:DNA anti-recombination protein RmuC
MRKLFNPAYGKYGVTVDIGPSYATKRIEASENMMAFMKALPNTAQMVADLFAAEQDWPGAEKIAARLAKLVPPQLMQPDMKDVPPQVQALMQSMETQIKQLSQQLQQAMAALKDKNADRAVDIDKIQKDYEAKLLKIVADTETKMSALEQKSHDNAANNNRAMFDHIQDLGKGIDQLTKVLDKPANNREVGGGEASGAGSDTIPPEALQHLKPGKATRFANGQTWSMAPDGKPKRHA